MMRTAFNVLLLLFAVVAGAAAPPEGAARRAEPNRLIDSGSPYLLQHAYNPVDWYPWGPEALEKARAEGKLIFLSVGYSTCYWCHVANRTLYSDPDIAALMNRHFVNIKVDREQRPDVDAVFMMATQVFGEPGGWPNNVVLTPDGQPFFAGSYFPPEDDAFGVPAFPRVLRRLIDDWARRPEVVSAQAGELVARMQAAQDLAEAGGPGGGPAAWLARALENLRASHDATHGGFLRTAQDAKFPTAPILAWLVGRDDEAARALWKPALDAMAAGGIRDHVGGGFHRYTVDRAWSVPHFEKMLYDNAQLLGVYAEAWLRTRDPLYREVARETAGFLLGAMRVDGVGFATALDAEIGGEEGLSYLWHEGELAAVLGAARAAKFLRTYALTPLPHPRDADVLAGIERGILRRRADAPPADHAGDLRRLREARGQRVQPNRDDKQVVALNGLAIESLARAGRTLREPRYTGAVLRAAEFFWDRAYDASAGRLRHEVYRGEARGEGFLDDYANLGNAFIALHDATGNRTWRTRADRLAADALRWFGQPDGRVALTLAERGLPVAPLDLGDRTQPSATAALLKLLAALGRRDDLDRLARAVAPRVALAPDAWAVALPALALARLEPRAAAAELPAAAPQGSAAQVRVEARRAGPDRVVLRLAIESGFHLQANPASFDYLIPTSVRFDGVEPRRVEYPASVHFKPAFAREGIDVYDGVVEIVADFPPGALAQSGVLSGRVRVQACDDRVCLPPGEVPVRLALE